MNKQLALLTALLAFSSTTYATDNNGFYLGAGYGSFSYSTDDAFDGGEYGELIQSSEGSTLKIYGGYQFNRVIAIEATYSDYGDTQGYVNDWFSTETVNQSPTSLAIAANVGYSFDTGLRPFALLGLGVVNLNSDYAFLDTDSPIAIKAGIGLEYGPSFLKGLELRVAYEMDNYFAETYYSTDVYTFTLDSFYAGLSYQF